MASATELEEEDTGLKHLEPCESRLYLSAPHMSGKERELILDAFDSNWIAPLGPHVNGFESEFAVQTSRRHAVATSSGTAALHLALQLLEIGPGDDVFVSTFTFVATANAVIYQGANPVFIDSDHSTWNIDPQLLEEALERASKAGELPKAIIVVDVLGQCADYTPILEIARRFEIPVIEDAAESLGATYQNRPAGTFGDIACFSFNGNKIITTSGGGMLVCNREDWADRARYLATQAREPTPHYEHVEVGYNYRLSNLLAAVGRGQLAVLPERVNRRRQIFDRYRKEVGVLPGIMMMPEPEGFRSTRWLTAAILDPTEFGATNDDIRLALAAQNIEARPLWKPMHIQPVFGKCRYVTNGVSEYLFSAGLCVPSGSGMSDEQQTHVIKTILACHESVSR